MDVLHTPCGRGMKDLVVLYYTESHASLRNYIALMYAPLMRF